MPQILKIPELVSKLSCLSSTYFVFYFLKGMAFITMMVARLALGAVTINGETMHPAMGLGTTDATITLQMVVYGFFMIAIVQLLGIFGGDRAPLQVCFPLF